MLLLLVAVILAMVLGCTGDVGGRGDVHGQKYVEEEESGGDKG